MKFLVCVSKTPETTAKIAFSSDGSQFETSGVNYIMNPYDEWYALVRALELKEAHGGTVTIINVGPATNDAVIRHIKLIQHKVTRYAQQAIKINARSALYVQRNGRINI